MLNKDLINNNDSRLVILKLNSRIQELETAIEAFKKYDEEKTTKINKIIEDYNTLSDLCKNNGIEKLRTENKNLKHQLEITNKKLILCNNFELIDNLSDDQVKLQTKLKAL